MTTSIHISWVSKESNSFVQSSGMVTWRARLKTASAGTKTSLFLTHLLAEDVKVVTDLKPVRWKIMVACFLKKHTQFFVCPRVLFVVCCDTCHCVSSNDVTSTWCRKQLQFRVPEVTGSNAEPNSVIFVQVILILLHSLQTNGRTFITYSATTTSLTKAQWLLYVPPHITTYVCS